MKQFTAWVIDSKSNLFLWARLKLTLIYLVIIASILTAFSVGLYINISKNIKDSYSDKKKTIISTQYSIQQADNKVEILLYFGNIALLFFSGGLAFILAGKNLKPIKKAMEKQKRFTADASHDLRTPLAIMKTDCEVMLKKKGISMAEYRELAVSNLEEVNRMSAMVEQLLFLSRNENIPKQELISISLGRLVEKMTASFKFLAEKKNITLIISEISEDYVLGNKLDLERMLSNILKNAINYTSDNGKVEISVKKINNQIKLSIKDDGIGMEVEDLEHATEAFYKADKTRSEEDGGSGLGLSIVKEIVKNHNGELVIRSEQGIGTEVNVFFIAYA